MYRTKTCGELRLQNSGEQVTLAGWVQRVRKMGGMTFVELRDRYGITQLVFNEEKSPTLFAEANALGREFVIQAKGLVCERYSKNSKLPTGDIEIEVSELCILNRSDVPPFTIEEQTDGGDELRMQYRYLDLRRKNVRQNLELRHKVCLETRKFLDNEGFLEIETPVLINSTPEGARDFVVPSRMNPGQFYALPQSPQLFKQLLMVAGMDRYFQIVKCFRDEDLRADRQPEFTQIDCEMSYVEQEDVIELFERMIKSLFKTILGYDNFPKQIQRMPWSEAMRLYGCDKPDLRFGMPFVELDKVLKGTGEFGVFNEAAYIGGICAKGCGNWSRKQRNELVDFVKTPQSGAKGITFVKIEEDGTPKSSIDKFYSPDILNQVKDLMQAEAGDLLLLRGVADDEAVLVAVLVQPFLLLGPGEADAGHGDVEGEAGLVLAGPGGGDRVVGGGEGLLLGPVGVVAKIGLDGLVHELLLFGVGAVGGGDLPVGYAVGCGPFQQGAQGFHGGLVRLGALVFDLQQVAGDVALDVHQMHRHIVLAQRLLAVDQDQEIRGGGGAGGQRLPFVEQRKGLLPRDAVRREAVDRLELDDRGAGVAAEAAVRRVGEVAQAGKGLLQPAHVVSLSAFFEGLVGFGRRFRDGHGAEGGGGGLLRHRRGGDQAAVAVAVRRAERREDRGCRRDGRNENQLAVLFSALAKAMASGEGCWRKLVRDELRKTTEKTPAAAASSRSHGFPEALFFFLGAETKGEERADAAGLGAVSRRGSRGETGLLLVGMGFLSGLKNPSAGFDLGVCPGAQLLGGGVQRCAGGDGAFACGDAVRDGVVDPLAVVRGVFVVLEVQHPVLSGGEIVERHIRAGAQAVIAEAPQGENGFQRAVAGHGGPFRRGIGREEDVELRLRVRLHEG